VRIFQYLKWMRRRDGGVVQSVLSLSQALAARGHQVVLASADMSDLPQKWVGGGDEGEPAVVQLKLRDRVAELRGKTAEQAEWDTVSQLLDGPSMRIVRDHVTQADIVHIHGVWTTSNLQVAAAARRAGTPYVVSPHGNLDRISMETNGPLKRLHHLLLSGRMLRLAEAIHCTSETEAAEGRRMFRNSRVQVIPPPFDTSLYRTLPGAGAARERCPRLAEGPVVLFVGRLHPIKNLERVIRGTARWKKNGHSFVLALAGPPASPEYEKSLRTLAASLGVDDRCAFLGMVEPSLRQSLYQSADVFVNLSSHENFSLVILEAMCCGTPAVTTPQTGIWRELKGSGGAFIVEDDRQLDETVLSMISDAARRENASTKARDWALQFVDTQSVMARYEALYTQAIAAHTHTR
jgi:glycosyltransferase involved in cell wall biosynthesis